MLSCIVICQLRQFERNQLASLQGADDYLLAIVTMRDNRCHQVGKHRLQKKAGKQNPGDERPPGSGPALTTVLPEILCSHYYSTIDLKQADFSLITSMQAGNPESGPGAIVSANDSVHKPART